MAARKPKIVYTWVLGEVRWSFIDTNGIVRCTSAGGFADKHAAWWDVVGVVTGLTGGHCMPAVGTCGPGAVREEGPGRKPKWSTWTPPPPFPDLRLNPPGIES